MQQAAKRRRQEVAAADESVPRPAEMQPQAPAAASPNHPGENELADDSAMQSSQEGEQTPDARAPIPAPGLHSTSPGLPQVPRTNRFAARLEVAQQPQDAVTPQIQQLQLRQDTAARPATLHQVQEQLPQGPAPDALHVNAVTQKLWNPELELGGTAHPCKVALQKPSKPVLQCWRQNHGNSQLYKLQLVADTAQPDQLVGVEPAVFITHSRWAAVKWELGQLFTSGATLVLPVRVSPASLYKLVHFWYGGQLELKNDVEEMMMLAHHLQARHLWRMPNNSAIAQCMVQLQALTCV